MALEKTRSTLGMHLLVVIILLIPGLLGHPFTPSQRQYSQTCTPETAAVRKEWTNLTLSERSDYIDAVLCAQRTPSKLNLNGTKSRYDDFAAVHINLTLSVHLDGIFFHWHRNFVHLWETFLRDECGYSGHQPYWNWPLHPNLTASPLFDGTMTSIGGNGYYIADKGPVDAGEGETLPSGSGGGCVMSGPFVNMTVNMGPFTFAEVATGLPSNWTAYNPRCLERDFREYGMHWFLNQTFVDLVLAQPEIGDMEDEINGAGGDQMGPHSGAHYALGPALMDFFASPLDPAFFLHHGMVDRLWTIWQDVDPETRRYQYNGTSTIYNANTTKPVNNETEIYYYSLGETLRVMDVVDPMGGPYCYRYEG